MKIVILAGTKLVEKNVEGLFLKYKSKILSLLSLFFSLVHFLGKVC